MKTLLIWKISLSILPTSDTCFLYNQEVIFFGIYPSCLHRNIYTATCQVWELWHNHLEDWIGFTLSDCLVFYVINLWCLSHELRTLNSVWKPFPSYAYTQQKGDRDCCSVTHSLVPLLLFQLSVQLLWLGRAVKDCPSLWTPAPTSENQKKLLASAWITTGCCSYLRSLPADWRSPSLILTLPFEFCNWLPNKQYKSFRKKRRTPLCLIKKPKFWQHIE